MRFSTPRMTPSEVEMPIAVEPSLMASSEYSTWKRRPSGEKVLQDGQCQGDEGSMRELYLMPRSVLLYKSVSCSFCFESNVDHTVF